jgi:hypothetical protein
MKQKKMDTHYYIPRIDKGTAQIQNVTESL